MENILCLTPTLLALTPMQNCITPPRHYSSLSFLSCVCALSTPLDWAHGLDPHLCVYQNCSKLNFINLASEITEMSVGDDHANYSSSIFNYFFLLVRGIKDGDGTCLQKPEIVLRIHLFKIGLCLHVS
jgi:hypothetical protein